MGAAELLYFHTSKRFYWDSGKNTWDTSLNPFREYFWDTWVAPYHYVIRRDGTIEDMQPPDVRTRNYSGKFLVPKVDAYTRQTADDLLKTYGDVPPEITSNTSEEDAERIRWAKDVVRQNKDRWKDVNLGYRATYYQEKKPRHTVEVCLIGGATSWGGIQEPTDNYTWRQIKALKRLAERLGLPIVGHRDLPGVESICPGFDVERKLAELETGIR